MDNDLLKIYEALKAKGLSENREKKILDEIRAGGKHGLPEDGARLPADGVEHLPYGPDGFYDFHDMIHLQDMDWHPVSAFASIRSLDEILEKDRQREKDGFPRKIRVGRMIKPGRGGKTRWWWCPPLWKKNLSTTRRSVRPRKGTLPGVPGTAKKAM